MSTSTAARRATTALLCGVVLVALGLAFIAMPSAKSTPESLNVVLDFDTFEPGVTQTRTSSVDIPVPSRVTDAEIVQTGTGTDSGADAIAVDLTICEAGGSTADCRPLVAGIELAPGPHTLTVDATLTRDVPPGSNTTLAGQVRIVETSSTTTIDTTLLIAIAGAGLLAIAIGLTLVRPRQGVAA